MSTLSKTQARNISHSTAVENARLAGVISESSRARDPNVVKPVVQHINETYLDSSNNLLSCWNFSKTLEHDATTGLPLHADVKKLQEAIIDPSKVTDITLSSAAIRKLEGVNEGDAFVFRGTDSANLAAEHIFYTPDSKELASEMIEVYAKAITRDVSFADIDAGNSPVTAALITDLNSANFVNTQFAQVGGAVTNKTVFRGSYQDEAVGPHVSQFLLLPFKYGSLDVDQLHNIENDPVDTTTMAEWLKIQNGEARSAPIIDGSGKKYIYNGRGLGSAVHNDPLYQFYYTAALIAAQNGVSVETVPNTNTTVFSSGGMPNIFAALADASIGALRVAWYQKWNIGLVVRPEVLAQRYHLANNVLNATERAKFPRLDTLKTNLDASTVVSGHYLPTGNEFLRLQYDEGSPTHPSTPAGHAVVAGTCTTILKAMFKCHDGSNVKLAWPVTLKHSVDGNSLVDYLDLDASDVTIVGEFNKLASNVSLGRDWSGVHYRMDGSLGMELGERYAITYLIDMCVEIQNAVHNFSGFVLEKFNGDIVRITAAGEASV